MRANACELHRQRKQDGLLDAQRYARQRLENVSYFSVVIGRMTVGLPSIAIHEIVSLEEFHCHGCLYSRYASDGNNAECNRLVAITEQINASLPYGRC